MPLTIFSDEYYMKQAFQEAQVALEENEIPIGAVVVCNDKIIARAHNQTETLNDVTAHAEMLAITSAANALGAKYLDECTLYVTLEPCAPDSRNMPKVGCSKRIVDARIKKIYMGIEDPSSRVAGRGMKFLLDNGGEFYLTHKFDYRGRCYDVGYYINSQGDDYQKYLIQLSKEEVING